MKSTKKVLAVLLATAMLCTIFASSAFAVNFTTDINLPFPSYIRSYYHIEDNLVRAWGTLSFAPSSRNVIYSVSCENINYDSLYEYGLVAQCAINYDDGSQDYDYNTLQVMIGQGIYRTFDNLMAVASNKTLIGFDAEFFVGYNDTVIWEGSIFPEAHILGINA